MDLPSFNKWLLLKEGKKKTPEEKQAYNSFISGKTDKIKLPTAPVARGHQTHISGTGVHDNRPRKQRTRKRQWDIDEVTYEFNVGDRVSVNGKPGEITSMVPGNGTMPWYYVQFDDGTEDRFTAHDLN